MTRWRRERDAAEHVTCKSDFPLPPSLPPSPRPCCRHAYTPFPRRRCKRRKERCDGRQPCGRCTERRVHNECRYETEHGGRAAKLHPARHRGGSISSSRGRSSVEPPSVTIDIADSSPAATPLDQSRLILDKKGRFMYLGDSANPSFLQSIRRLVRETQGPGPFVDDPLRPAMVEASPEGAPAWLDAGSDHKSPPALTEDEARHFARQFYLCTNGILDLYDKPVLLDQVPRALARDAVALPLAKPVVYLILALGAQSSPKDLGEVAESCFNYGRYLSARYLMDDPSTLAVEAYILIAMYLLAASRRNAAFMHLGFAVRAAYALGLHLKAVSMRFTADEFRRRERIWKSLRSIDILSSALLGRPPATKETRDTAAPDDYSACSDLLAIMEQVLTDVYEQRQISATTLNRVASRQREWAAVFTRGLAADNIEPGDGVDGGAPNMGLTHLKVVFHWTVMLLTRPFLSERVAAHARQAASSSSSSSSPAWTPAESSRVLAHACVNSAIRTLALLEPLVEAWDTPTRLPFSVSCVVHSALVVGLAHFGDMHQIFPLDKSMYTARSLLQRFSSDAIAFRNCTIVRLLHEACQAYAEKRHAASMDMDRPSYPPSAAAGDAISLIDKAFGDDAAAADASWDSVSPAKTTVQPLSPSSTPATMPKHDDDAAALPLEVSSVFDGGNILGDEDIVNLESRDDLVSLYALIDTSGGYLGLE
ncbi:Transcription factor, fungi, partial [Metarhizium hybridum]